MKVYLVQFDVNDYQQLFYNDKNVDVFFFRFNGTEILHRWVVPKDIFISNPMRKKGDFRYMGEIILLEKAKNILAPILDPISEYLEFEYEREKHTLLNVTYFCDCLDKEKSEIDWAERDKDKSKFIGEIYKYVFRCDKIPDHSLFRLPGPVVSIDLFTIEGCFEDKNKEFKYVVEKNNLKGLKFKLVWDSEAEG